MAWVEKTKQKNPPKTKKKNQHRKRVKKSVYGSALHTENVLSRVETLVGHFKCFPGRTVSG